MVFNVADIFKYYQEDDGNKLVTQNLRTSSFFNWGNLM